MEQNPYQSPEAIARIKPPNSVWPWKQFAIAAGMVPLSFVLWIVGLGAAFNPRGDPLGVACLVASPFVCGSGVLWILVLIVRYFWRASRNR